MKRFLALLLALTMLIVPLAGCGSATETKTEETEKPSADEKVPETTEENDAAEKEEMEPMTFEILMGGAFAEYPPDGGPFKPVFLKALEDQLGITNTDYKVMAAGGTDYQAKLNAMMAGGDIPDYFDIGVNMLPILVENGIVAPIDSYVEKMPAFQALLEVPGNREMYDNLAIDGQHYVVPRFAMAGELNGPCDCGLIIRTDWLENLGLEIPTTLDELHEVLRAFTFDDPDGNGEDDTYGLGGGTNFLFNTIFGAYGIYMRDINSWMERDGKLVHSTVLPETKEVLALLADWYQEGIIDSDAFVITPNQAKEKFTANRLGVYECSMWAAHESRLSWGESGNQGTCLVIDPPMGPNGDKGYPVTIHTSMSRVLSQECVDEGRADRLMTILNWMCDDSENGGQKLVQYGVEGENYDYDAETNHINSYNMQKADSQGFGNVMRWINVVDRRWLPADDPQAIDLRCCNKTENWVTSAFSGTVPAMIDYPDLFAKTWNEYFTKIVTGILPVDAWDDYVEDFYALGGEEMTEQVNEAWKG